MAEHLSRVVLLMALAAAVGTARAGAAPRQPVLHFGPSGLPDQISWPGGPKPGALAGPCRLALQADGKALPAPALRTTGTGASEVEWQEQALRLGVVAGEGELTLNVANLGATERTLDLRLVLPLRLAASRAFFAAGSDPHRVLAVGAPEVSYGYGAAGIGLALPLGTVYSAESDWGLTLFGDHRAPIPAFGLTVARTGEATTVTVSFPDLRCRPGEKVTRQLYLAPAEGDWRPALAAALARFPSVFEPQNPAIAALHGPFVCGGGTPPDSAIEDWYAQGTRVVEIHGTAPFYGLYVPDHEPFVPFCDDAWHSLRKALPAAELPPETASWRELRDFVEKRNPPTMTRAAVRDYITRLHRHNIKGLIYFNPTEAWAPWAAAEYAGDRVLGANGQTVPTWYESVCMIPDKNRPWGRYVLDQMRGELAQYPEVDGVFFDQSAGGGHDLTDLCAEGARVVRAQGKICWWNGPYNAELAAIADGMMSEGGGTGTYRTLTEIIQYYGIAGKPIVSLGPATDEAYCELLSHGLIPQPVGPEAKEIGRRWFPLFQWLRNRRWVLRPRALEAPPNTAANLLQVPGGNYVVTLVPLAEGGPNRAWRFALPVTARVGAGETIKAAYLLTPDLQGYHKLTFSQTKDVVTLSLPRLRTAGVVVLAASGVFASLEGDLHALRGSPAQVTLALDNWTTTARSAQLELRCGAAKAAAAPTVAPGKTARVGITVPAPADPATERLSLDTVARVGDLDLSGKAELAVTAPLVVQVAAPSVVRDDETATVRVQLLSYGREPVKVRVEPTAAGLAFEPTSRAVAAPPGQPVALAFNAKPTRAGKTSLKVTASAGELRGGDSVSVEVVATALAPSGFQAIRWAELSLDVFGSDAGPYANKPIKVNGVAIGTVPQGTGDSWAPDQRVTLPPAALSALKETNDLVIENQVGDAFKVRNLRLILHMRGGVTVVSTTDRGVYTGWEGWLYGEGKQVPSGQPLTGIRVTIPLDPHRTERYEEAFGQAAKARLILEVNGSDGGQYAHKVVSINDRPIGDLPQAGDWTEKSLDLTPDALAVLCDENQVKIENSDPPDAFKVRRARIEVENAEGKRFVTATDEAAYTSCGWEFAEGTVGSPIRFALKFAAVTP